MHCFSSSRRALGHERGSIGILGLGVLVGAVALLAILGAVGAGFVAHAELQQAVDVGVAVLEQGGDQPASRVERLARANGAERVDVTVLDGGARVRIRVARRTPAAFGIAGGMWVRASGTADIPVLVAGDSGPNPPGQYSGPLVTVDGVQVCPVVGAAYQRMDAAAARDGITLTPTSGFRTFAQQAALYAQLGPRLAAPPGTSRHHDATELDINVGPAGSTNHRWLQGHGSSFGFVQRYSWEPWHWGYVAGCAK